MARLRLRSEKPRGGRRLADAVVWSFPLAFALHDAEEVLTAGEWGLTAPERLRRRFPNAPQPLVDAVAVTGPQAAVAVGTVAAGVAAATALAVTGRDRDLRWFQSVLAAYSLHGLAHLGQSAAFRGYTPGVATVPAVIVPYSWWAWRRLRRAGVVDPGRLARTAVPSLAAAFATAFAGHVLGRAVTSRPTAGAQSVGRPTVAGSSVRASRPRGDTPVG